jgi:uncharacterized protein YcgL (UPF0745 family)
MYLYLANEDIEKVTANLKDQGYHVQLLRNLMNDVLKYQ